MKKIVVGDVRQWMIRAEVLAIEEAGGEQKFMETLQKRTSVGCHQTPKNIIDEKLILKIYKLKTATLPH